jgi:3',5'-cyclic AMP phosphodiesterase CpdA
MIKDGRVSWGGGLGKPQRSWLAQQLDDAKTANEAVIVFCHYPIDATSNSQDHLLWDHAEVSRILANDRCVKAWFCGHNHQGGYGKVGGVHHVTFQAICDAPPTSNAWAIAECQSTQIRIFGHGTVPSRVLDV